MRKTLEGKRRFVNGRRGSFQLLFSVAYLLIGLSYVLVAPTPTRYQALGWVGEWFIPFLGYLWIVPGLIGLAGVSKPRGADWFSFSALSFAPMAFGALFAIGALFGAPLSGIMSMLIYWVIGAGVLVVSGMSGDGDRCARRPPNDT